MIENQRSNTTTNIILELRKNSEYNNKKNEEI